MMRCNDCKCLIDELKEKHEYRGEAYGRPAYETVYVCPNCGSNDIDHDYKEDDED